MNRDHDRRKGVEVRVPEHVKSAPVWAVEYALERTTEASIRRARTRNEEYLAWSWQHYSELAFHRQAIADDLHRALGHACRPFAFSQWQRAVRYKYSLHPMSTLGSTAHYGGRFNMGRDINSLIPSFPALYIASERETALLEALGQPRVGVGGLTPQELALANPQSETIVSVSGEIDEVVDLVELSEHLQPFVELMSGFALNRQLRRSANRLDMPHISIITTVAELVDDLLQENWRRVPANQDIPANGQIFGQIVREAGIAGIRYPSKMTGNDCVAVFPSNFVGSTCFVSLDDEPPPLPGGFQIPRRYDEKNVQLLELDFEALALLTN